MGGTRISIGGEGFATDFWNGGNTVHIGGVPCDVVEGACTVDCGGSTRIVRDHIPHSLARARAFFARERDKGAAIVPPETAGSRTRVGHARRASRDSHARRARRSARPSRPTSPTDDDRAAARLSYRYATLASGRRTRTAAGRMSRSRSRSRRWSTRSRMAPASSTSRPHRQPLRGEWSPPLATTTACRASRRSRRATAARGRSSSSSAIISAMPSRCRGLACAGGRGGGRGGGDGGDARPVLPCGAPRPLPRSLSNGDAAPARVCVTHHRRRRPRRGAGVLGGRRTQYRPGHCLRPPSGLSCLSCLRVARTAA